MSASRIRMLVATVVALAAVLTVAGCKPTAETGGTGGGARVAVTPASTQAAANAPGGTTGTAGATTIGLADSVTAMGTGKALSSPDIAEMTFGVSARKNDASDAMGSVSATGKKIADALKKAGVAAKDIQTTQVSLWPETDTRNEISGYRASITVRAKVRELASLGDVIGAASKAGSNEMYGPSFIMDDSNPAKASAIEGAITDAKARAEVMAKAAGRKLGRVIAVVEQGASVVPQYAEMRTAKDMAASVPIEPGQVETMAGVSVTFELR